MREYDWWAKYECLNLPQRTCRYQNDPRREEGENSGLLTGTGQEVLPGKWAVFLLTDLHLLKEQPLEMDNIEVAKLSVQYFIYVRYWFLKLFYLAFYLDKFEYFSIVTSSYLFWSIPRYSLFLSLAYFILFSSLVGCRRNHAKSAFNKRLWSWTDFLSFQGRIAAYALKRVAVRILDFVIYLQEASEN